MISNVKRAYDWMGNRVYSRYADVILGILFFLEAIFFIPTDPMLILYCIERRDKAYYYATIATLGSVLGGITGYYIGYTLWIAMGQQIIHHPWVIYIMTPETFSQLCALYKQYEALAILVAAFTPIPYKAATLTAGFCNLALVPFIVTSLIGRGARFYLYAIAISKWGKQIKQYIDRYFNLLLLLIMAITVIIVWLMQKS